MSDQVMDVDTDAAEEPEGHNEDVSGAPNITLPSFNVCEIFAGSSVTVVVAVAYPAMWFCACSRALLTQRNTLSSGVGGDRICRLLSLSPQMLHQGELLREILCVSFLPRRKGLTQDGQVRSCAVAGAGGLWDV